MARSLLLMALILFTARAFTAETDQYLARAQPLEDSTQALNDHINGRIEDVLASVNKKSKPTSTSCKQLSGRIMWRFRLLFIHQIEIWALQGNLDVYPPRSVSGQDYRDSSIFYDEAPIDLQLLIPLARSIQVDGITFGIDKLGHFVSLGHKYYKDYLSELESGLHPANAEIAVITKGFGTEEGMIGSSVSGVFSYADLEANYQGFRFVRSLCDGPKPRIRQSEGLWVLVQPIDIREYVNPYWDESFNNSVYTEKKWQQVRNIMQQHCADLEAFENLYSDRFTAPSANMQALYATEATDHAPTQKQHSLASACAGTD